MKLARSVNKDWVIGCGDQFLAWLTTLWAIDNIFKFGQFGIDIFALLTCALVFKNRHYLILSCSTSLSIFSGSLKYCLMANLIMLFNPPIPVLSGISLITSRISSS